MKIGIISRKNAEYLGMSASVAGGFVMIGDEWMNVSRVDTLLGYTDGYLAAIPDHFSVPVRPIPAARIVIILREDAARVSTKQPKYAEIMETWAAKWEAVS